MERASHQKPASYLRVSVVRAGWLYCVPSGSQPVSTYAERNDVAIILAMAELGSGGADLRPSHHWGLALDEEIRKHRRGSLKKKPAITDELLKGPRNVRAFSRVHRYSADRHGVAALLFAYPWAWWGHTPGFSPRLRCFRSFSRWIGQRDGGEKLQLNLRRQKTIKSQRLKQWSKELPLSGNSFLFSFAS